MCRFDDPWVLWLLPLALLPLWLRSGRVLANGWLAHAPRDRASEALGWALRGAVVLAIAALLCALAGPYRPEYSVQRLGQGAEIVLVLDRSRSMDQGFAPGSAAPMRGTGPEALNYYFSQTPGRLRETKGSVARRLLTEFTARRPDDRYALIVFSTLPIPVLAFTHRRVVVDAAIGAGNVGRGLAETNIGLALEAAFLNFEGRPYSGSRIVLLVSDGGDHIEADTRERLAWLARKMRVGIYWIYLRSANSAGLKAAADAAATADDEVPEIALDRYFRSLDVPYRAYEASDAQALQRAIDDVNRLEHLPIVDTELMPRRDLASWAYAVALAAVLLLLAARRLELRQWS
ncbi:MAG: VWA domain-containing protein [Burkholderiales bacterium]|nr:VWA domain-containing protein [Burkholderiales bacterium]